MRDLIIKNVLAMFPDVTFVRDFQILVNRLRPGLWQNVPMDATPRQAVNLVVDLATIHNWLSQLVAEIPENPSNRAELEAIKALIAAEPAPTTADPFAEVLLDGNRPFVNRVDLRSCLRALCSPGGSPLLMVDGQPLTGKSFSFYLAQHIARQRGFIPSQFEVDRTPHPQELAAEILDRMGVNTPLRERGNESAERWAEKLASQVKDAIEARGLKRLFVFDFPVQPAIPPETASLVVRLAKFADEELQPWLRIILIQFTTPLPTTLDDVADRDEALPFTDADMLAVLKQIGQARGWVLSERALMEECQALQGAGLRDRFRFLRRVIYRLSEPVVPQPTGPVVGPGGTS